MIHEILNKPYNKPNMAKHLFKQCILLFIVVHIIHFLNGDFYFLAMIALFSLLMKGTMSSTAYLFTVLILLLCPSGSLVRVLNISHLLSRKLWTDFHLSYTFWCISLVNCLFHSFSYNISPRQTFPLDVDSFD